MYSIVLIFCAKSTIQLFQNLSNLPFMWFSSNLSDADKGKDDKGNFPFYIRVGFALRRWLNRCFVVDFKKIKASSTSSRNLWVSGLSGSTSAKDLKQLCSKYGKVIGAKVVTNARTPGSRCYGYVTMAMAEDANNCIEHLHRTGKTIVFDTDVLSMIECVLNDGLRLQNSTVVWFLWKRQSRSQRTREVILRLWILLATDAILNCRGRRIVPVLIKRNLMMLLMLIKGRMQWYIYFFIKFVNMYCNFTLRYIFFIWR